jgi:hypothetical protein
MPGAPMADLFSKLFGKRKGAPTPESAVATQTRDRSRRESGRREKPAKLDWSQAQYVPLPPAPETWGGGGSRKPYPDFTDPVKGPVFRAGAERLHTKVVKLADGLSPEQLEGDVGEVVTKAYRHIISQRFKAGQLNAAAKQSLKMFETVPSHVQDKDKRRFNRIIGDMDKADMSHRFEPVAVTPVQNLPLFTLSTEAAWTLAGEHKLATEDRPDPAFEIAAVDHAGTWLLHSVKTTMNNPDAKSAIRRIDRTGRLVAERELPHDTYRVGKGSSGSSIAIMDSDGCLHIYDANVNLLKIVNLADDPRVTEHFATIETNYWGKFKTQIRAVDVGPQHDSFLFTLADEAWCCTLDGRSLWGVVMPLNEGWRRVIGRSGRVGTSAEADAALRLLGLSLPVTHKEIKREYRVLSLAHHPDMHPDDPDAHETQVRLSIAYELLTGVDAATLSFDDSDVSGVTHFEKSAPDFSFELYGFTVEMTMEFGTPQDWVYAASFAANGGGAYVATYSGKVILVSKEGQSRAVYDLGVCPIEILDNGRYTYFLTRTRLYVVEDQDKLAALLDVYQQGRLIVSEAGFGLLTDKMLQWFTVDGTKQGTIQTRDPIRAIYATEDGAVIQTRQHQVGVQGLTI